MCAIIRITWKAFRTVISRVEFYPISKGCRETRHPSDVKYHPMNGNRKDLQGQPEAEEAVRNTVQKPLDRLSVKRCRGVVKRDTPAFLRCVSARLFLSSISTVQISPVRLQSSFARWKQEACHGIQHLCSICRRKTESFRISPRSWPRWRKIRKCDQPLP